VAKGASWWDQLFLEDAWAAQAGPVHTARRAAADPEEARSHGTRPEQAVRKNKAVPMAPAHLPQGPSYL